MSDDSEDPFHFEQGELTYLQLPATDLAASGAFYTAVFGWHAQDESFDSPGLIGQWATDRPAAPDAGPLLWLHVRDMALALERTAANGGQVVDEPIEDGPTRTLATVIDPAGNRIGLVEHRSS